MDKMTKKIIGAFIAIIIVAAAVTGIYFAMNQQAGKKAEENTLPTTEAGKLLAKDLELKYPQTPTEVVKLYWRINRCMYNDEELGDSDFEGLLGQLRKLYDEELLAQDGNSYEEMLKTFKQEKEEAEKVEQVISACVVQKNDEVKITEMDGKECAIVVTSTLIKASGQNAKTLEKFMCRRDSQGNWKILGWQQATVDEASDAGIE